MPRNWCCPPAVAGGIDYGFGLPRDKALHVDPVIVSRGDAYATDWALRGLGVLRRYAGTRYAAKSWGLAKRRVAARIEASSLGLDIRFVVTPIETGSAEHIYGTRYCARGQAENRTKLHKAQLKSDRTSCRSANANQMRLILHTAALRNAEFASACPDADIFRHIARALRPAPT